MPTPTLEQPRPDATAATTRAGGDPPPVSPRSALSPPVAFIPTWPVPDSPDPTEFAPRLISELDGAAEPQRRRLRLPVVGLRGRAERLTGQLVWPPPRYLLVRISIAGAIVIAAAFTNRTFLGWGLFATLAVLFVPIARWRSFILSFVPYAGVWFIFTALRSLADATVLARLLNTRVASVERWLFGGDLPSLALQERLLDPQTMRLHDYLLTGVHWSYYIVPQVVAIRLWHKDPVVFRHYLRAMTLLLAVGLAIYFLIPTNPPWLAPDPVNSPAAPQVARVMEPVGKALGGGLYAASYRVIGESNPIAAMPSIHMAITFLLVCVAGAAGRRWRLAAMGYAALMGFALVYLGEHYVIDVAVGVVVAAYAWFAVGVWRERAALTARRRSSREVFPQPTTQGVRG